MVHSTPFGSSVTGSSHLVCDGFRCGRTTWTGLQGIVARRAELPLPPPTSLTVAYVLILKVSWWSCGVIALLTRAVPRPPTRQCVTFGSWLSCPLNGKIGKFVRDTGLHQLVATVSTWHHDSDSEGFHLCSAPRRTSCAFFTGYCCSSTRVGSANSQCKSYHHWWNVAATLATKGGRPQSA